MKSTIGWLLALAAALVFLSSCDSSDSTQDDRTATPSGTTTPRTIAPRVTPSATPPPTAAGTGTGVIEGSLSYPSSGLPPELIVCAYEIDTGATVCTDERIEGRQYLYSYGYRLVLAPGRYELYEAVPGRGTGEGRGYFTELSRCGDPPPPSCPRDHTRIVITLDGGETITGINPDDWDPLASRTAAIEGSLSYPGSVLPPGLFVCAEVFPEGGAVCTRERIEGRQYLHGYSYRLALDPGRYEVYAAVDPEGARGYYTEFSRCGDPSCPPDHTRIVITLGHYETVTGINPDDWDPSSSP